MKDLLIIGAGGLGREVLWQIKENPLENEKYNILGFVDDNKALAGSVVNGYPVLGNMEWLLNYEKSLSVVVAIGNSVIRKMLVTRLKADPNLEFPSIFASGVKISEWAEYGEGCIFCLNSIVTVNIKIGNFFISNWNCTVGHDCVIDDYVTLYPNVNVSGNVHVGEVTELGTGTQIIQGKKVGSNCIIGAGAVVNKDIPDNSVAVGVPAKVIKRRIVE